MTKANKATVLDQAKALVYGDRQKAYGSPSESFQTVADMWNAYIRQRAAQQGLACEIDLEPVDVVHLMTLLKVARLAKDPHHKDSIVDVAGYAAVAELING